jgi:hypothetical protein
MGEEVRQVGRRQAARRNRQSHLPNEKQIALKPPDRKALVGAALAD